MILITLNHGIIICLLCAVAFFSDHNGMVRHYHIKQDEILKYYVSEKHRFTSIKELIEYHKLNCAGLVVRLRRPPNQLAPNLLPLFGDWTLLPLSHLFSLMPSLSPISCLGSMSVVMCVLLVDVITNCWSCLLSFLSVPAHDFGVKNIFLYSFLNNLCDF